MTTAFADDTRRRWIQLGCGPHPLPSPWENYDREVNVAKPLPFPDGSARYLFAEHLIEHITFTEGMGFLSECHRVLEPGGVLRLTFPDVTRLIADPSAERIGAATTGEAVERVLKYESSINSSKHCAFLDQHPRATYRLRGTEAVYSFVLTSSGHKCAWSEQVACCALIASGFSVVEATCYGDSVHADLRNIERHHFSVPELVALSETTVIEATK